MKRRRRRTEDIPIHIETVMSLTEALGDELILRVLSRNKIHQSTREQRIWRNRATLSVEFCTSPIWTLAVLKDGDRPFYGITKRCITKGQKDDWDPLRGMMIAATRALEALCEHEHEITMMSAPKCNAG